MSPEKLLKKLNKNQFQAVTHNKGPLLIVAGAGTGKTTVLINRLAYLIIEKKIKTDEILLLTFTEKAAGEMEERADKILPYGYVDLWIHTFHGFCEKILRDHALEIGLNTGFKLLSTTDQWILIKKNLSRFNLDYYRPLGNPTKFISELLKHFSRLKDENISAEEYIFFANNFFLNKDLSPDSADFLEGNKNKELANAFLVYNQLLLENNYFDFGDLIVNTIELFKARPNILNYYRNKFKYIMVDEFQDTNLAQYELIKILASPKNNLVVVGDDDQAIYKFRGASISNIMKFKEDYSQSKELILVDNYRSKQEILDYAYDFIQHNNPYRLEKKLTINKKLKAVGDNSKIEETKSVVQFLNFNGQDDEVNFVASEIKKIYEQHKTKKDKLDWLDFAILVRANDTADAYVKELARQNIPHQFMSWRGLYYKSIILDILAYLRLLDNYHEPTALFRVLSMDIFKVSHTDTIAINKQASRKVWSLYEALQKKETIKDLDVKSVQNIDKLLNLIKKHSALVDKEKPTKIFLHFVYDSGLLENLDKDRDLEIFSYLNQFYQKIKSLEENSLDLKLKDFLESINLEIEAGETGSLKLDFADNDTVKIMTIHGAKGLEFKYVFIVNLVDKKFPTIARGDKLPIPEELIKEKINISQNFHIEEERRLFYVAVTRAKNSLYLTAARDYGGVKEKKPSRFIEEMGLKNEESVASTVLSKQSLFVKNYQNLQTESDDILEFKPEFNNYTLPEKFSFSQLAAFANCPLQYKFAFILKIPAPMDKPSLIFGRVLHNTLYNFLFPFISEVKKIQANLFKEEESQKTFPELTEKRLLAIYNEFWQPDGFNSKEERQEYYQKGLKALKKFLKDYLISSPQEILFLEKKFSFRIGQDIIKGTIDRVDKLMDGTLEIIDYKTGQAKNKLEFKDKRQLILYQIFLEEFLQIKVSLLSYYYLEDGTKVSFKATDKEIDKLKIGIKEEIAAIKKKQFIPKPSMMCNYCDFNTICEFRQT